MGWCFRLKELVDVLHMGFDVIAVGASLIDMVALVDHFPMSDDEVFVPEMRIEFGGSAANTAVGLARLGFKVAFFGKVGHDYFGDLIINKFEEEKVDTSLIVRTHDSPTGIYYIAVDKKGDRRMFAHSGAANQIQASELKNSTILKETKILYLASLQNTKVLRDLAIEARNYGTKVIINPGALIVNQGLSVALPILKNTDVYISSLNEALRLFNTDNLELIKNKLFSYGITKIAITLGSRGCYVADRNSSIEMPVIPVKIKDTTGAGDAFTAGFIAAEIKGGSIKDCGLTGLVTAALTITKIGARNGLPTLNEFKQFISDNNIHLTIFG
ncbi:MAG: carbohydrate kinase family protein [Candidatus Odinarchaeia archaeon]